MQDYLKNSFHPNNSNPSNPFNPFNPLNHRLLFAVVEPRPNTHLQQQTWIEAITGIDGINPFPSVGMRSLQLNHLHETPLLRFDPGTLEQPTFRITRGEQHNPAPSKADHGTTFWQTNAVCQFAISIHDIIHKLTVS